MLPSLKSLERSLTPVKGLQCWPMLPSLKGWGMGQTHPRGHGCQSWHFTWRSWSRHLPEWDWKSPSGAGLAFPNFCESCEEISLRDSRLLTPWTSQMANNFIKMLLRAPLQFEVCLVSQEDLRETGSWSPKACAQHEPTPCLPKEKAPGVSFQASGTAGSLPVSVDNTEGLATKNGCCYLLGNNRQAPFPFPGPWPGPLFPPPLCSPQSQEGSSKDGCTSNQRLCE